MGEWSAHQAVEQEDAEALARLLAAGSDPHEVFSNVTLLTHAVPRAAVPGRRLLRPGSTGPGPSRHTS
ncbi:hypothetical protein E5082_32050 [Streptomyces griseoluteus]|uniref:Uncharacterized protein n=1 Tax=Streptomyces griseoluteus TaxID=29306 RepID=A0A4Z1CWZ3_STRGP|nr:hypothetical protein E5082_32050 [Streptomyces griseoluteus]